MRITSDEGLTRAVQEYQTLQHAAEGSPQAARRDELDAAINDYYQRNKEALRKGRPEGTE